MCVGGEEMLASKNVMATIAVKDMGAATRFSEGTLGLKRKEPLARGALAARRRVVE